MRLSRLLTPISPTPDRGWKLLMWRGDGGWNTWFHVYPLVVGWNETLPCPPELRLLTEHEEPYPPGFTVFVEKPDVDLSKHYRWAHLVEVLLDPTTIVAYGTVRVHCRGGIPEVRTAVVGNIQVPSHAEAQVNPI